jgi:hypothetical protein
MTRGQIRRLAAACGVEEQAVVEALQRGTVDHLVEGAFDDFDRSFEQRLGDLWQARCFGEDPSSGPTGGSPRRQETLSDAWLARSATREVD